MLRKTWKEKHLILPVLNMQVILQFLTAIENFKDHSIIKAYLFFVVGIITRDVIHTLTRYQILPKDLYLHPQTNPLLYFPQLKIFIDFTWTEAHWNPIFDKQLKLHAVVAKQKEHCVNVHLKWFLIKRKIFSYAATRPVFTFQVQCMTDETITLYSARNRHCSFYQLFFSAYVSKFFWLLLRLCL